jgi:hypothetical protein
VSVLSPRYLFGTRSPETALKGGIAAERNTATTIRAELIGDDRATELGIEARSAAPPLDLCRKLVVAGHDPVSALDAYLGTTLSLMVRSVGEAADLEVKSKGTGFVRRAVRIAQPTPAKAERRTRGSARLRTDQPMFKEG